MNVRELIQDRDRFKDWWHNSQSENRRLEREIRRLEDQRLEALQEQVDHLRSIHPPSYVTLWARVRPDGTQAMNLYDSEEAAWADVTMSFSDEHVTETLELASNDPEMKQFAIDHGYKVVPRQVSQ